MSKTIYNVGLYELLPQTLVSDSDILAKCAAFDAMHTIVVDQIDKVLVLSNIGNQTSDITNVLAIELQTPYYNQSLSLEARRALVAGTGKLNSIKGTKTAVKDTVKAAYGSCAVQEWFEYSGEPFHFRVLINEFPDSDSQLDEIKKAIAVSKNARSYLDGVIVIAATTIARQYIASAFKVVMNISTSMSAPS